MNFDSFSHGQILSKLWLCEELEKHLTNNINVLILGAWYNVLATMLLTRQPNRYSFITGIDIDPEVKPIADKICDYWVIIDKIENRTQDVNNVDYTNYNLVINCSVEHIEGNDWFEKIPNNTLVCIQSSNVVDENFPWLIKNPNPSLELLKQKYPLSQILFEGEKTIDYESWGYKRFMLIGIK